MYFIKEFLKLKTHEKRKGKTVDFSAYTVFHCPLSGEIRTVHDGFIEPMITAYYLALSFD